MDVDTSRRTRNEALLEQQAIDAVGDIITLIDADIAQQPRVQILQLFDAVSPSALFIEPLEDHANRTLPSLPDRGSAELRGNTYIRKFIPLPTAMPLGESPTGIVLVT